MQIIRTGDIFQSTLPRRERLLTIRLSDRSCQFQSTLPRRERQQVAAASDRVDDLFQSTLPRRERLGIWCDFEYDTEISIHAPAKGATRALDEVMQVDAISIHAPAKGATAFINIFSLAVRLFFISSHQ